MSFQLLDTYLKVGNIVAITPPSVESNKNSKFRQIHQVIVILLTITCVTVSVYFRNFYLQYNFAKITLCLLTDIVLCTYSCRIVIEASKVLQWSELISGLKNTSCLLEEDDNDKRKWIQWKFVLPQLTFFIAVIYILRTWFSVLGLLEFGYVFELLQIYLQFCHSLYLHTLLEMIRQRYEALKRYFEKGFSRNDKNLHQMSCFACTLKDTVNRFNEIFGWSLLFLIAFTTLQFLNSLEYSLEYNEFGKENASHIVISQVITVLLSFLPTSILLLKFENIMAEFDNIVFLVTKSTTTILDVKGREEMERFGDILTKNLPQFSAARFFVLGRSTILSIFGTVATFFIILVTFVPNARLDHAPAANLSLPHN